MDRDARKRERPKRMDEARLAGRAQRSVRTSVHRVIPRHFFSAASSECRDVFIDGLGSERHGDRSRRDQ